MAYKPVAQKIGGNTQYFTYEIRQNLLKNCLALTRFGVSICVIF
jgi:hypothetical protein